MSGGNWGGVHKAFGIAAAGFILFCAFAIVWNESALRTEEHVKAAHAAHDYATSADEDIRNRCTSLKATAQLECVKNAIDSSRENQREEHDLVAQQQAARWTMVAGGAASVGLLVSIIGVWLVRTTYREAKRSADAATDTHRSYIDVEKPRIVLGVGNLKNKDNLTSFDFQATNIGGTSCVVVLFSYAWLSEETEDPMIYSGSSKVIPVNAGCTATLASFVVTKKAILSHQFLRGRISYESALGGEQTMPFLFRIFPEVTYPHSEVFVDILRLRAHRERTKRNQQSRA